MAAQLTVLTGCFTKSVQLKAFSDQAKLLFAKQCRLVSQNNPTSKGQNISFTASRSYLDFLVIGRLYRNRTGLIWRWYQSFPVSK
jgi:hypothetical protein